MQNLGAQIRCIMGNVEVAYKMTLFTMFANFARAFGLKGLKRCHVVFQGANDG